MTEAGVTRTSDSRTARATGRDIGDSSFIGGDGTSREMNRRSYATAKAPSYQTAESASRSHFRELVSSSQRRRAARAPLGVRSHIAALDVAAAMASAIEKARPVSHAAAK